MTTTHVRVFFDTEMTSLLDPYLLSVGFVTLDGRELYAELDMASEFGRERLAITPWDVREGVLDKFGAFPESKCDSEWSLGRRVGDWLLRIAESSPNGTIELLYDYGSDFELLVGAIEECNLWPSVRVVASESNIGVDTGAIGPELASEATFGVLRRRAPALFRHHALADALALRAAWRTWSLVQQRPLVFRQLIDVVGPSKEGWLYEWLASPAPALNDQVPLDVLDQDDSGELVGAALARIMGGCA